MLMLAVPPGSAVAVCGAAAQIFYLDLLAGRLPSLEPELMVGRGICNFVRRKPDRKKARRKLCTQYSMVRTLIANIAHDECLLKQHLIDSPTFRAGYSSRSDYKG